MDDGQNGRAGAEMPLWDGTASGAGAPDAVGAIRRRYGMDAVHRSI